MTGSNQEMAVSETEHRQFAMQKRRGQPCPLWVRKAALMLLKWDFCFCPANGLRSGTNACLKGAINGLMHRPKQDLYSITSSARASSVDGTVKPNAFAV